MIRYLFYIILMIGVLLLAWPPILRMIQVMTANTTKQTKELAYILHLKHLFRTLHPEWSEKQIYRHVLIFVCECCLMFVVCFRFLIFRQTFSLAFVCAVILAALPYTYLRVRYANRQLTGSYEGKDLIVEFLNQYKIHHLNAKEAIDRCLPYLDSTPINKKLLFRMSIRLKTYRSDQELQNIMATFSAANGTEWGKLFAQNLYYSILQDTNIVMGLEDLLKDCADTQKAIEHAKRKSTEAVFLIRFLAPAFYIILMGTIVKFFQVPLRELIQYQFSTSTGILLALLIVILAFICICAAEVLNKPKFDI